MQPYRLVKLLKELKTDTSTKPINGIIKTGAPIDVKAKGEKSSKIIMNNFESEEYITSNISFNQSVRFGNNVTELSLEILDVEKILI